MREKNRKDGPPAPLSATGTIGSTTINYASNATYDAAGDLTGLKIGGTGPSDEITVAHSYDKRLQPLNFSVTAPGGQSILNLSYNFGLGSNDNGNIVGITNNRDSSRSLTGSIGFTYDSLNRLQTAATTGSDCTANSYGISKNYGEQFGYDPWGNVTSISPTKCSADNLSAPADLTNRITGYCYDAAGNLLNQGGCGTPDYSYDVEGFVNGALGNTYYYDVFARRVQKNSDKFYVYDNGANVLAEGDASGNFTEEYVYFAGQKIARLDISTLTPHYYFSDHLGSAAVVTDASGNIEQEQDFAPFGTERTLLAGGNDYKFTGLEQDSETGFHHALFRLEAPNMARWLSPDPASLAAANPSNPQSLNRYAYVMNSPIILFDPYGLQCAPDMPQCQGPDPTKPSGIYGVWHHAYISTQDWIPNPGEVGTDESGDVAIPIDQGEGGHWGPEYLVAIDEIMPSLYFGIGGLGRSINPFARTGYGKIDRPTIPECAAATAESMSLATKSRIQGDNIPGKAGQLVLGNAFSGAVDTIKVLANKETTGAEAYSLLARDGLGLGVIPAGGPAVEGAVGTIQDTVLKSAFKNLGREGAETAADVVGNVKLGYDFLTFGYSAIYCIVHY